MTRPLYRAVAKARLTSDERPGYAAGWLVARRGWLSVFPDRLECGPDVIRADEVQNAVLYRIRGLIPGFVLAVRTPQGTWQFGLNPWTNIQPHLPFPVRRERVRLRHAWVLTILRAAALALVAYLLYQRLGPV
jgi:hypothetical protein